VQETNLFPASTCKDFMPEGSIESTLIVQMVTASEGSASTMPQTTFSESFSILSGSDSLTSPTTIYPPVITVGGNFTTQLGTDLLSTTPTVLGLDLTMTMLTTGLPSDSVSQSGTLGADKASAILNPPVKKSTVSNALPTDIPAFKYNFQIHIVNGLKRSSLSDLSSETCSSVLLGYVRWAQKA
jgi:hypothetical protein